MPRVEIVCLANSRKLSGRCIAGLRIDGQGWVRPVADRAGGTLFAYDYSFADGSEPRVLDTIAFELTSSRREPHQPENWIIGAGTWELVSRSGSDVVTSLLYSNMHRDSDLFGTAGDRISYELLKDSPTKSPLTLIEPQGLQWVVTTSYVGRRQIRASFHLIDSQYRLVVTDPVIERRLAEMPVGVYQSTAAGFSKDQRIALTVSLGEPFDGACFKLVAAAFPLPTL